LRLAQRGSLPAAPSPVVVMPGAALSLDDSGTHFSDRIADNQGGVTFTGGALTLSGNAAVPTEEVINNMVLDVGSSATVTLTPGAGQSTILRIIGSITRALTNSMLFRGTSLGANAPGTANSASLVLNNAAGSTSLLVGCGGPAGSSSVSIIGGAFGDTSSAGLGTQLVTYDLNKGVRLLDPITEYTTTLQSGSIVADNVKADGATIALTAATTANALWLNNGGSVTGSALTLTSGTGNNELVVLGKLDFSPSTVFALNGTFANFNPADRYSFRIATVTPFDITAPAQFDVSNFTGYQPAVFGFEVTNVGSNVYLNFVSVPEPDPTALVLAGALLVFSRFRRRGLREGTY
jgi:hypothetical protein